MTMSCLSALESIRLNKSDIASIPLDGEAAAWQRGSATKTYMDRETSVVDLTYRIDSQSSRFEIRVWTMAFQCKLRQKVCNLGCFEC